MFTQATAWSVEAACSEADPEWFFSDRDASDDHQALVIEAYCLACPVRQECLIRGLEEREGIWGGTTPAMRKELRKAAA